MKHLLAICFGLYVTCHLANAVRADQLVLVAGGGVGTDNVPATKAKLIGPFGVDFDKSGNMYIVEMIGQRLLRVDSKGMLTIVAGTGKKGNGGDGGPARLATFNSMHNLAASTDGFIYLADTWNNRIRKFDPSTGIVLPGIHKLDPVTGIITAFAGTGKNGYAGDGGPALKATFTGIYSLAFNFPPTKLYLADLENRRIRVIDMKTGNVDLVAGNGKKGVPEDGADAKSAPLVDPRAVTVDRKGNVYILERSGNALRVVDARGKIRTVAGTGKAGFSLGGGAPLKAQFNGAKHLCVDLQDNVIIADSANHRVLRYSPKETSITLLAGTGKKGDSANGGPALEVSLNEPHGVFVHPSGTLYIVDSLNNRVFRLEEEAPTAFRGARIHTASGPVIEQGVLIVHKGKIIAVGAVAAVKIPPGAVIRDLTGKTIIPGLVDTHSHIGIFSRPQVAANNDGNEMTGPVQPGLRAIDAINPDDPGIRMAVAGGVTTANIMPGSGNAIGGQTLYVKLKGTLIDMMRALSRFVLGGIKFANGENPKGVYGTKGQAPGTRMKIAALQREMLVKAKDYKRHWDKYRKDLGDGKNAVAPDRDLALEPLVEVLERRRTVHFHCHRADDILTAVRLAKEFGFELVLQHCTEGYRIAADLAKEGIWVSLTLIDSPGGKPEVMGLLDENAAILHKAGVKIAINTDDFITESRFFLRSGAIAVRGGLPEDVALKALTLHGAQMLHLDDRIGSLEKGKDADFVVLSGAPFSVYTHVLETYIEGDKVFDRALHQDRAYQVGGFALPGKDRLPKATPSTSPYKRQAGEPEIKAPDLPAGAAGPKDAARKLVVLAGRIHTVGQGTIDNGVIVVENGKITHVGPRADFKLPNGVPVMTAAVVTPGLIDTHSVVGLSGALNFKKADQDQDELSDPNQADLRVLDSFNPTEPLLQFIREQGVTVVQALPGRANVIAGQAGIFRTYGRTAEGMALRFPSAILVNMGEIPKSTYPGKAPSTRMGTANLVRTAFAQAQAYSRKKATAKEAPGVNLKHEALEAALRKKLPVIFAAHRADDLATALRLAKEFELKPMLTLATEGYLIADEIAQAKVPVIVHPTMQRPASMETFNSLLGNAAFLADKNIPIAIGTAFEGYVPKTRVLRYEAAMAMVNGLGFERALRSITVDAARILAIDDHYGSLEPGKVADLVLYDGDPFEHKTHVTHTIMDGRVIYDRAEYLKMPFERRVLPLIGGGDYGCCLGAW